MAIAVTGASGRLGRLVVDELLMRVPADELILITRTPGSLSSLAARGIEVRAGDFADPEGLRAAFGGAERALVISTAGPNSVARHRLAFEAAGRASVRHLVYTSVQNPVAGNPFPAAAGQRASEHALHESGVAWTVLRNALYADLRAELAASYLADGRWATNTGDGQHAFVSRQDCAAAAAGVLAGENHEGRTYSVTGPELVGAAEFTGLLAAVGGRRVDCVQLDDAAYEEHRVAFQQQPENASFTELFTGTGQAIRTGYLSELSDDAARLSGRPALLLREVLAQHLLVR